MSDVTRAEIRLTQLDRYRFAVRMERPEWTLTVDEPPPVGEGAGPNPARLIATAIGHCLSSSLLYCLERARVQGVRLETSVDVEVRRNDRGRWRISGVRAKIDVQGLDPSQRAALARCRSIFEDYCIATASVRQGIPVEVEVRAGEGPGEEPSGGGPRGDPP
jgi:uncharacterized OsmC-like protein